MSSWICTKGWQLFRTVSPTERKLAKLEIERKVRAKRSQDIREKGRADDKNANEIEAEVDSVEYGEYDEYLAEEEAWRLALQKRLLAQSQDRLVPLPPPGEPFWERPYTAAGDLLLTIEGLKKLQSDLRKDRLESWEFFLRMAPAATGLVGTLIGLVVVLKGC